MGLDELVLFKPEEKIIEYQLGISSPKKLAQLSLKQFMEETASESPAPGGGSVSAAMASLGTALSTMAANLSSHKRGWDERWEEFSDWAEKSKAIQERLMELVDEDTDAFNGIITAIRLPKNSPEEQKERNMAIRQATIRAIEVPFEVMKNAYSAYEVVAAMVDSGNPGSVSDAGVGAVALHAAIEGSWMNVMTNSGDLKEHKSVISILEQGREILSGSASKKSEIIRMVNERIGSQ
jgi:glutamate formiminotransferase/formiminotetrahydrofolate cyclodeaminase